MTRSGPTPEERSESSQKPRGFSAGWLISVAAHLAVLAAVLWWHIAPPRPDAEPSQIIVNMVEEESQPPGPPGPPGESGAPPDVAAPIPEPAVAPDMVPEPEPAEQPVPVEAVEPAVSDTSDILSESQLVGAASADDEGGGSGAGGGGGSGGCNTARVLQNALRRDPMVQNAVVRADRAGKAVMLWNGDWVRAAAQDGKGLSGVRQALLWELAFAPEACRAKQMRGLVILSLQDGTRFAIGADRWRWSDLLGLVKSPTDR